MVYMLLGTGFEETEAVTPIDLLRRAGVTVATVGIGGKVIVGSHGIPVTADMELGQMDLTQLDMIVLPGGMKGVASIKGCPEALEAVRFAWENGRLCLKNLKMDELSHLITGEALLNANNFWKAIETRPIVTLEDGQTWSFERAQMKLAGQRVYQITGTNITEEARLQQALEKDNLRLKAMNRRLRQYGRDVHEVTREREILRTKTRIHDEIGHALLQTRQFLSGVQGDAETVCAAWRQTARLLLGGGRDEAPAGGLRQLAQAAREIGVTIQRRGVFPAEGTENAHLVEAAAHECLTNLVRHANGSRLEISGEKTACEWRVCYRNDGDAPAGPIVEGSGLTALRAQTEAAGGAMTIEHAPRFQLTLILPQERQEST